MNVRILPIDRNDQDQAQKTLEEGARLILNGAIFNIFPEAGRTRREEFSKEDVTPGAAKIVSDIMNQTGEMPVVLSVYMRSESQIGYSDLPARGKIHIVARKIQFNIPENISKIRRRKIISDSIGEALEKMQAIWKNNLKKL